MRVGGGLSSGGGGLPQQGAEKVTNSQDSTSIIDRCQQKTVIRTEIYGSYC